MNQINVHLKYLISRHDCVIVPGFGAFISETQPAFIDEETLTVYPSRRRLSFNPELTMDDGLLSHSIARREKMTHQDARRIIDHSVESFLERMADGKRVILDGIGQFSLSEEGKKIFEPFSTKEESGCTLPEESLAVYLEKTVDSDTADTFSAENGETVSSEEVNPASASRSFNTRRNYYLPINKMFARVACAMIIVIGGIIAFTLSGFHQESTTQQASIVPVETLLNMRNKPDSTTVGKERHKEVEAGSAMNEQMRYHLIVGTFTTREEAERYIAYSEDDSTSLTPIEGRAGMWRVALQSSDERESLQKRLNEVKNRFDGVWIWEKR